MDFNLNEEQLAIQKAAEEFAKGEFDKEIALDYEKTHGFPHDILKKACQLGFVGIHYPEAYGGQGYGVLENALVAEALCRQDSGLGIALSCADSSAEMILRYGSDEQKSRYLPRITRGEAILQRRLYRARPRKRYHQSEHDRGKARGRVHHQRFQNLHHQWADMRLPRRSVPDNGRRAPFARRAIGLYR